MTGVTPRRLALLAVVVIAVLAVGVSAHASSAPDGLEWALRESCVESSEGLRGSCPAVYERRHVLGEHSLGGSGLAAGGGAALALLLTWGGVALLRKRGTRE